MSATKEKGVPSEWVCGKCGEQLQFGKVGVAYLRSHFTVDLLKCSKCGLVLITEALALGKMVEAEKALEDK
jgi:hypothetical protein